MKKIHSLLLVLFLSSPFLMVGCEEDPTCTIKIVSTEGGDVNPSGSIEVEEGSDFSVSVIAHAGFVQDSIFIDGNGSLLTTNRYDFLNVNSDHKVKITFKRIIVTKTFSIEVIAGAGGTVTPLGTTQVVEGSSLSISIVANLGFITDSIIVDGVGSLLTSNEYSFSNISSSHKVRIVFEKTLSGLLMDGKWSKDSTITKYYNETVWTHTLVWGVAGWTQEEITFLTTGRISAYWDGIYVGDSQWSLCETVNPPTLTIGGPVWIVEKLTESALVLARYDVILIEDPTKVSSIKNVYSHH